MSRQVYNPRKRRWEYEDSGEPSGVGEPLGSEGLMPFGKHAGLKFTEIETGYLRWVLRECAIDTALRSQIESELDAR